MKFYQFRDSTAPVILLLPGTCCHWKLNFGEVISSLANDFHVICVSYDGFDETERTVFSDMLTETAKIEQYILEQFGEHICAAYGCSFPDETFDAVTSNYVYHNIVGKNKQALLRETLGVLKKGGTFAIHDLMEPMRYGDMEQFVEKLKAEGYEDVQLIPTTDGKFMSKKESKLMMLSGSMLLVGRK